MVQPLRLWISSARIWVRQWFRTGGLKRLAQRFAVLGFLLSAAFLAYQQGERYAWFLGAREAGSARETFETSHWTYFAAIDGPILPEFLRRMWNPVAFPIIAVLLIVVIGGAATTWMFVMARARQREVSDVGHSARILHYLQGTGGIVLWCAALGITLGTVNNSEPPPIPAPEGALSVTVPEDNPSQKQWTKTQVWFPPTLYLDTDADDNLLVLGVTIPKGQRPEFSIWLPHALSEDRVVRGEPGRANRTEALSGCEDFTLTDVTDAWGSQVLATCVMSRRAMQPVNEIERLMHPDRMPVVIKLGGFPRYWFGGQPVGGIDTSAIAIDATPAGGTKEMSAYGQVPIASLPVGSLNITSAYVDKLADGGSGSGVQGMSGDEIRIEPAVMMMSSNDSVRVEAVDEQMAMRVGKSIMFRGEDQATPAWQAAVRFVQPQSLRQVNTANTLALIILGTAPFGALVASRRRTAT